MDEDIDIEEHDVMDNPKIRDIFPDLSLVKIEAPDEDEQGHFVVPLEYELEREEQTCNIKEEILSDDENNFTLSYGDDEDTENNFVQNANNHFEESVQCEQYENREYEQSAQSNGEQSAIELDLPMEFEVNNEYRLSNKIILGSKPVPCLDYDKLYDEALHSTVTVTLENWELKLKNSPCYCQSCEILFPTTNVFDAHKSMKHSLLVALETPKHNTARKSTVTTGRSTYCNHCNKTFPNDNALIKHLYELLPLNSFPERTPAMDGLPPDIQYKCRKCKKYFKTLAEGKEHKILCHPHLKTANIVLVKKAKTEITEAPKDVVKKPLMHNLVARSSLVPKSVLFLCNVCFVGFLSCYSASQHARTCENKTDCIQCKICKRRIRSQDFSVHELQHKYNDKLKIYTLNKKLYDKIIMKCPKCCVCFDEKIFWSHRKTCNAEKVSYVHCKDCNLDITSEGIQRHRLRHTLKKITSKDFIVIEFYDLNAMNEDSKNNLTLYYCEICRSYKALSSQRGHRNGLCKSLILKHCDKCGLGFGKQQYKIHRMNQLCFKSANVSVKDYDIYSLHTGKKINPPMPEFHQCPQCQVQFLFKQNLDTHNCHSEKYETCRICSKKYNLKAFEPHIKFHEYQADSEMPKLLKMYNSINSTWNILYQCVNCNIVTVSYDSAVEHSQNHICGLKKQACQLCDICQFNIVNKDYRVHMNLHENNSNISREEFTVLKFNFKDMFKKKWMNIFLPLPKQHKYQILGKSIYRCTRRFKLNCAIDQHTDSMKFYCKNCKMSVNIEDMKKHYFDRQCKYSSKYVCKYCNTTYKTLRECVAHETEHDKSHKNYTVYTFNEKTDEDFNQRLLDFDTEMRSTAKPRLLVSSKVKKFVSKPLNKMAVGGTKMAVGRTKIAATKNNMFKIYKCRSCQSCMCLSKTVTTHKCTAKSRQSICHICNNYFFTRNLFRHLEMHRQYGKKVTVVYFNPPNKDNNTTLIYKCDCGLHFTSRQAIDKHLNICNDNTDISKEICSKCHLLFPTDLLVTHLCKHHVKSSKSSLKVVKISKQGNFKCANCSTIYPNMTKFDNHIFHCPSKNGRTCKKCNVNFLQNENHRCVPGLDTTVIKKSVSTCRLYKCHICNVHYFHNSGLKYHIEHNHNINLNKIVTCKLCRLRFCEHSMPRHMQLHETEEYYMIKIIDSTGSQRIARGPNVVVNTSKKRKYVDSENTGDNNLEHRDDHSLHSNNVINREKIAKTSPIHSRKSIKKQSVDDIETVKDREPVYSKSDAYKCSKCNICYAYKKNWHYHIERNHVTKREIFTCEVCGLRFLQSAFDKHQPVHQFENHYCIKLIEPDTNKITYLKGVNIKTSDQRDSTKRNSGEEGSVRKRSRRFDDRVFLSHSTDDQSASTSKIDFESLPMSEETIDKSDFDNTTTFDDSVEVPNTLVNSCESILPDDIGITNGPRNGIISKKLKSILNIDSYSNTLYKCESCRIHFMTVKAANSHFSRYSIHRFCSKFVKCNLCGLHFTRLTLIRHIYVHHRKMELDLDSLNILPVTADNCVYLRNKSMINHAIVADDTLEAKDIDVTDTHEISNNEINNKTNKENDKNICIKTDAVETETTEVVNDNNTNKINVVELDANDNDVKDKNIDNKNDTVEVETTQDIDENKRNNESNISIETNNEVNKSNIHYYKCAECNVCFISDEACRTHCTNHKLLDPKVYYECKICNFQFMYDSLMTHVTLHHSKEFCLEDLVITEYTLTKDRCLNIETYYGMDKLQSRLISTTTDLSVTD